MYIESINNSYSVNVVENASTEARDHVNVAALAVTYSLLNQITEEFEKAKKTTVAKPNLQLTNISREREVLLYNCQRIVSQIKEHFAGSGGLSSSAYGNSIRDALTQYLYGVNSDESWKLLREMQSNNFADWVRL